MHIRINKLKKNYLMIPLLIGYVIVVYPLIYGIAPNNGVAGLLNKLILLSLIMLFAIINNFTRFIVLNNLSRMLLVSLLYMMVSLAIYSPYLFMGDIIKEVLYSFVPFLLYFIVDSFDIERQNLFLNVTIYSLLIVIGIGVLNLAGIVVPIPNMSLALSHIGRNFQSYYSAMEMGYSLQLLYGITLFRVSNNFFLNKFRIIFLGIFSVLGLLTLQRGCYLGFLISTSIYLIYKFKGSIKVTAKSGIRIIAIAVVGAVALMILVTQWETVISIGSRITGYDIEKFIGDEFRSFNYKSVASQRTSQAVISNTSNPLWLIFGEGFGKYSPNNSLTVRKMPDASYYRIFDELGMVGFALFFVPYIFMFLRACGKKRAFSIYFILCTFAVFFFNRILWMIPLNFFIYPILCMAVKEDSCLFHNVIINEGY